MKLKKTRLHILQKAENLRNRALTGISLHCHTQHSRELMDFVPIYAEKLPIVSYYWKRERRNYIEREGRDIDFLTAYWSPPLPPDCVYRSEIEQIENSGLDAIVSVTDHDCIEANLDFNAQREEGEFPISMEWTVPYRTGFFHVGVHNLPPANAKEITETLLDFTFDKGKQGAARLNELFAMLWDIQDVLIVLNHPAWDIEMSGEEAHANLLKQFLGEHGRWLHALEFNGFRSWSENMLVVAIADEMGLPVVTGGDRHGCKPNTVINLTQGKTFAEFVDEVRTDKHSEIVMMPEYSQPLPSRQLQSFAEILSEYPEFPEGRRKWFDRTCFDIGDGNGLRPLSDHWRIGGPKWLRAAIKVLGILGDPRLRPVFRMLRNRSDRVPQIPFGVDSGIIEKPDVSSMLHGKPVGTET